MTVCVSDSLVVPCRADYVGPLSREILCLALLLRSSV